MTYVRGNPKTKKALKEALAKAPQDVFNPGLGSIPQNGTVHIEGPQYPAAHMWGGTGTMKDGMLVSIS